MTWKSTSLDILKDHSATFLTIVTGVEDTEERHDLIRRHLAMVTQLARCYGEEPYKSFEELVTNIIEESDRLRTEGVELGIL